MHRFVVETYTSQGHRLGRAPATPDFQPAREYAYLEAVRRGALSPTTAPAQGAVEPLWSEALGAPYLRGVRVRVCDPEGRACGARELPVHYFFATAQALAASHLASGDLAPGDPYRYHVCAYPEEGAEPPAERADAFEVAALAEPIPVRECDLASLLARSTAVGEPRMGDVPVLLASRVIDETCELARAAGRLETGGVLVGHLHRDRATRELCVEITAQIPARHGHAEETSFSFTHDTWADAHAQIARRGAGELMLGWVHSHPLQCSQCPVERRRTCRFARPFFSGEDLHLHRTCFPRAWQIALLISDLPERGLTPALFAWRRGRIASRGFLVHDAPATTAKEPACR